MNPSPDRRWWALLGLLVLVAHASLFGVGPVGEDFRILAETSRALHAELGGELDIGGDIYFDRPGTSGRPLAALSLGTSSWLWTRDGVWTPGALGLLRFENLLLLLAAASVLARFLKRLVSPWVGAEQAAAAGQAALLMLMVHPLSVTAVASPAGRGDLLGGTLALLAATCFLRGRQEHNFWLVVLGLPLTLAATLASELGYLLPLCLAVIEYFSSRRYRPGHVRLRTAITTLVIFGAAAGLDVVLRLALGVDPWPADLQASLAVFSSFGDMWLALLNGLIKLGVLILPVNGANAGGMGFVVAGLLIVVVVQPALHAGLSAPRFWLTVLCSWLGMIILTEATRAGLHVGPTNLSAAAGLFPAVVVMAMGLALASTAVSGSRRQALPIIVACLLCTLARSNARGWRAAAKDAAQLSSQMAPLVLEHGNVGEFLVLEPPGVVDLYAACPDDLAWMLDMAVSGVELEARDLRVRGLSPEALVSFSRLAEFDELRDKGLTLVFPVRRFQPAAKPRWVSQSLTADAARPTILGWRNPSPEGSDESAEPSGGHWVGVGGEQPFFADPADVECLTIRIARPEADPAADPYEAPPVSIIEAPEIYWRARGDVIRGGELRGMWLQDGEGQTAVFDPGSDIAWLLGQRVDSLLLMGELAEVRGAEVWVAPPSVPNFAEPAVDGDDWYMGHPPALRYLDPQQEETWTLTLLDLVSLQQHQVECQLDAEGDLVAPEAEELSQVLREEPGSLAWGLERRVGELVLQRVGGRF